MKNCTSCGIEHRLEGPDCEACTTPPQPPRLHPRCEYCNKGYPLSELDEHGTWMHAISVPGGTDYLPCEILAAAKAKGYDEGLHEAVSTDITIAIQEREEARQQRDGAIAALAAAKAEGWNEALNEFIHIARQADLNLAITYAGGLKRPAPERKP